MKNLSLLLLTLVASVAVANNEIYLEQEGNTGTFNITQVGSSNRIGESTDISVIKGDDSLFNISQIGNSNALDINYDGSDTVFDLYIEGNSNSQDIDIEGEQNTISNVIFGDSNSLTISKDLATDDPSNIDSQSFSNYIIGNSNTLDFYLNDNINAVVDVTIAGSSNSITSIQEGSNAGLGHSQTVEMQGSNNTLELVQSGMENQTLELTHYGNDSTFTIIQSDGTYTAGLEGANVISNFDGSYTQVYSAPGFLNGGSEGQHDGP